MLFDTHAHLYDTQFAGDLDEVVSRAKENGVGYILTASENVASSVENITLTQKYDIFYAAVGIHPHNAVNQNNSIISVLKEFASYPKVVAIGEIGLDYYYDNSPRDVQKTWFAKQISLAGELKLPVIVHDRDAHEDTLNILKSEGARDVGGVLHCFSGSVEMAREVMELGFMISIAGPATFRNARKLPDVIRYVPDDMLLIETDSPYLAPEPHRGRRNEPAYVKFVAEKIAKIKGKPFEYICETTTANAKRLFGIP
ncbi:MAG TPA: TatD family hydrolase [Clostridiales bacterium]|nr:TatD family hydrolase [Clostridiales bacterium]HPP35338.1 TatD family hydrolase [Clostridiales bacterium]